MRHTVVIGGTRGIGRVIAGLLVHEGGMATVIGRNEPRTTVMGMHYHRADLTSPIELNGLVASVIARHGGFENLIFCQRNRVGGDEWESEMSTSLGATNRLIEAAIPNFQQQPGVDKSIIILGSIASSMVASEQTAAYHAAKAGLVGIARYYALQLGGLQVRVNVVTPGTVIKPENVVRYEGNTTERQVLERLIPLGRMGTAVDVARAVAFLCSKEASFITGQNLHVDGGVNLHATETLGKALSMIE